MQKKFVSLVIISLILMFLPFSLAAQSESHSYIRANGKIIADNFNNGTTTQLYYYHHDALGNLVSITDQNGKVVESQRVEAFGNELSKAKIVDVSDRSFIGKEKDSNNLFYFGARYYDPSTGRFISTDPLSGKQTSPQTQNKYSYAVNNPLKYVDLNGKSATEENNGAADILAKELREEYGEIIPGTAKVVASLAVAANEGNVLAQMFGPWINVALQKHTEVATLSSLAAITILSGGVAAPYTLPSVGSTWATTTAGTALAGETIKVVSQAAPEIAKTASVVAQTTTAVVEATPAIVRTTSQIAPKAMQVAEGLGQSTSLISSIRVIEPTTRAYNMNIPLERGAALITQLGKINPELTKNPQTQQFMEEMFQFTNEMIATGLIK